MPQDRGLCQITTRGLRKKLVQELKKADPKMSNRQIAKKLGVTHATVNRDIGGTNVPKIGTNVPAAKPVFKKPELSPEEILLRYGRSRPTPAGAMEYSAPTRSPGDLRGGGG
jgi:hypothetical protein